MPVHGLTLGEKPGGAGVGADWCGIGEEEEEELVDAGFFFFLEELLDGEDVGDRAELELKVLCCCRLWCLVTKVVAHRPWPVR